LEIKKFKEELSGAVARGWCTKENENKEMDVTLAEAITNEVIKTIEEIGKAQEEKEVNLVGEREIVDAYFRIDRDGHAEGIRVVIKKDGEIYKDRLQHLNMDLTTSYFNLKELAKIKKIVKKQINDDIPMICKRIYSEFIEAYKQHKAGTSRYST
jgi:hypothetical protein